MHLVMKEDNYFKSYTSNFWTLLIYVVYLRYRKPRIQNGFSRESVAFFKVTVLQYFSAVCGLVIEVYYFQEG